MLEDRLCFLDIRLVALLLLRLPSMASESPFFLQQLQHRTILSHPHFLAPAGTGLDLPPSSTETLDPPIIPVLDPTRIPTLEPAIDLLAKHLQQPSFLRQPENFWQHGHSRENRPPPPPPLDWVIVAADLSTLAEVSTTGNLERRRLKYYVRVDTKCISRENFSRSPFKTGCKSFKQNKHPRS